MHHPVLATVITQSQIHVQIKHLLACLQDLIVTLADVFYIYIYVYIYICMYIFIFM